MTSNVSLAGTLLLSIWHLLVGTKMLDPHKLAGNQIFLAVVEASKFQRSGSRTVDVTKLFRHHLSGLPYSVLDAELDAIGLQAPPETPAPGGEKGFVMNSDILNTIPETHFRPGDRVVVRYRVEDDGRISVRDAVVVNTLAFP